MVAARTRLEIATENLANASTDGFRHATARGALTRNGVSVTAVADASVQGGLRHTGRDLDLAIVGPGSFVVADAAGRHVTTRAGSFTRERDGTLRDATGRMLLAGGQPLHVPEGASIDEHGRIVSANGLVAGAITLPAGSSVRSGFLESAGVDAIHEMIDVLSAQRSFESAQKVVSAIDRTREKSSGDVARLK